jgi:hypothetical protein
MNECALLAPPVSGNGPVPSPDQAIEHSGNAFLCSILQMVLNDVCHIWTGVKLVATVALSVTPQS